MLIKAPVSGKTHTCFGLLACCKKKKKDVNADQIGERENMVVMDS